MSELIVPFNLEVLGGGKEEQRGLNSKIRSSV